MPTTEERFTIDVPGATAVSAAFTPTGAAFASLALFHGAGAGMDHPFMSGFAEAIASEGVASLRCNFPYMEAGKRSPDRQPVAVATVRAAFDAASERTGGGEPVWVGGKSFGGRMASVAVAEGLAAAGIVFLGYPFHPPGKPDRVRDEHLYGIDRPMLFLQGTKDPFGTPAVRDAVIAKLTGASVHLVEGGGHSLERSRRDDARDVAASFAPLVAAFMRGDRG
ncbi:MAG TPA: alpha/beta family hydrolase [Actinomycetota bacterium]|nr:alpha/beta family hydrolase [Actinomycetota bacterium]